MHWTWWFGPLGLPRSPPHTPHQIIVICVIITCAMCIISGMIVLHGEGRISPATPRNQNNDKEKKMDITANPSGALATVPLLP